MASFMNTRKNKSERLTDVRGIIISDRLYNSVMGFTVLYGLVINILMCHFCARFVSHINPLFLLLGFLLLSFAGSAIAYRSASPVIKFLGYNMIVFPIGLLLTQFISWYGGLNSLIVIQAFNYTLIITAAMIGAGILFPSFFAKIGGILFSCLIGIIVASIFSLIFHFNGIGIAFFGAIVFSLYIGYDFWRSQQYPKTTGNAISCATDIYLDMINLFMYILRILGNSKKS